MINGKSAGLLVPINYVRSISKISPWRGVIAIFADWLLIGGVIWLSLRFPGPLMYLFTCLIIGTRMYALYSLLHDGMHYLIVPNWQFNDVLSKVFLAWPLFVSLSSVRKSHFAHHAHLKTADDPESLHLNYREFKFPKPPSELLIIFFKDIVGFNYLYYKAVKLYGILVLWFRAGAKIKFLINPATLVFCSVVFLICHVGMATSIILYWIIPYITIYQALNRLRLYTEHINISGETLYATRTVKLNFIEQFIFSPHNLGFHTEHHLFPAVPHYRLRGLHKKLMAIPAYKQNAAIEKSYFNILLNNFINII